MDLHDPEERMAAAGEYVLGTLSAEDTAAVIAALQTDRGLQADVYAWQDRLLSLSARVPASAPRPQLWQRIDVALNAAAVAVPDRARAAGTSLLHWWQRIGAWQGISGASLAAALCLAVVLLQRQAAPDPAGERYVAVLQSPADRSNGWIVEVQRGRTLRLVPVAATGAVPAGRSLQFWTKPQGADAPTSLGLVRAGQSAEMPVSRLPGVGEQQLFEITLEPESGSPSGRPTGPILYVGRTVHL